VTEGLVQLAPAEPRPPEARARFLEVADAIGCGLVRDAIWSGERCTWLVWTKEAVDGAFCSAYRAAPTGLYLGNAGIALFLSHLARFTGDPRQAEAASGALAQVEAQLAGEDPRLFGFYTGSSGAAWALIEAAALTGDTRWRDVGLRALRRVAAEADLDISLDLLGGQAGLAAVLAAVGTREGDEGMIDAAARVADRLCAAAHRQGDQASWPGQDVQSANLLGLSHGTTGIALALLEVNRARANPVFAETAAAALRYERARFDPVRRNWPDYRIAPGASAEPLYPVAWCHGATGIGIARLRMHDLLPEDAQILPELDAALATALSMINAPLDPATSDITLCHGVTGNNEFVLMAGERFGRADALAAAAQVGDVLIAGWHRPGMPWGCGIPHCGETPSLLTGTAGIGYHFLRLYDAGAVPSVLLPPPVVFSVPDHPADAPAAPAT
jgi:lantibiotic modifying enzyme